MGADSEYSFMSAKEIKNVKAHGEFITVYPLGKKLTKKELKKLNVKFIKE